MNKDQMLDAVLGYLVELAGTKEAINILKRLGFSDQDIIDLEFDSED